MVIISMKKSIENLGRWDVINLGEVSNGMTMGLVKAMAFTEESGVGVVN